MKRRTRRASVLILFSGLAGMVGCSGLDRMERKLDMVTGSLGSGKPAYEGRLTSARVVGPMTSLQFADGQIFDVEEAPAVLLPGDIVGLYKTEKGIAAHLRRSSPTATLSSGDDSARRGS